MTAHGIANFLSYLNVANATLVRRDAVEPRNMLDPGRGHFSDHVRGALARSASEELFRPFDD